MKVRVALALALGMTLSSSALAQTVIVQDNFDQYADTAAFKAVWVPTTGLGTAPAQAGDVDAGILTSDPLSNPSSFPGLQGQAVDHVGATASTPGMVNQWGGVIDQTSSQEPDFNITPSASESVFLKADIFVGSSGNERMTVGLRHTTALADDTNQPPDADTFPDANTRNIFEMGVYNATPTVLGIPGTAQVSTGYAFRIINFGTASPPLAGQPNWQYFELPIELDRETDADTLVNIADVGAGWHTYTATFTPTEITVTIDLFRDGLRNTSITPDEITGIRPGTAGVDASLTFPVATQVEGFNNLRIGGPSGLSSAGGGFMGFDNILLQLQAASTPGDSGDFDNDGDVDSDDLDAWKNGFTAGQLQGGDFLDWQRDYAPAAAAASVAAVPEPASLSAAALALLVALGVARRRTA